MKSVKLGMESKEGKRFPSLNKRTGATIAAVALIAAGVAYVFVRPESSPENRPVAAQENIIRTGQWSYMPGTELKTDGLHIEHRDFRIVQQDGSGGQPNPPVNEYGTHLNVPANFTIQTEISDRKGPASIQFYASPPVISDEFRVEPKSIRLTLDDGKLTVRRWDGQGTNNLADQAPVQEQAFAAQKSADTLIKLIHKNRQLSLVVDGKQVGTIPVADTFDQRSIWIGADAEGQDGHFTIASLMAESQDGGRVSAVDTSAQTVTKHSDGLQELVAKRRTDFKFGADVALWAVTSNPAYRQRIFGGDFGVVTPENELKWQFTEPQPGIFDFHQADALVNEAKKHAMSIHGHNLVFSEALPRWVQDLPTNTTEQKAYVKQVLTNHVTALVNHYKGVIDDWDINEIFADEDSGSVFRDNVFYRALGPDYVRVVAEAAHAANSNVKIWLNDYGMETDTGSRKQAADKYTYEWKQAGLIYGVGRQAHIYDTSTDLIVNKNGQAPELSADMDLQNQRGVMVRISELDAPRDGYDASSQVQQFSGIVKTCLAHPNCKAVGFWSIGPSDVYQQDGKLQMGVDSMFDQQMRPTDAYYALQKVLR